MQSMVVGLGRKFERNGEDDTRGKLGRKEGNLDTYIYNITP